MHRLLAGTCDDGKIPIEVPPARGRLPRIDPRTSLHSRRVRETIRTHSSYSTSWRSDRVCRVHPQPRPPPPIVCVPVAPAGCQLWRGRVR